MISFDFIDWAVKKQALVPTGAFAGRDR